jgi:hypothetical protein
MQKRRPPEGEPVEHLDGKKAVYHGVDAEADVVGERANPAHLRREYGKTASSNTIRASRMYCFRRIRNLGSRHVLAGGESLVT